MTWKMRISERTQFNSALDDVMLEFRANVQKLLMLLSRAESHDILNPRTVIPTAIKDYDFAGGGKMSYVALNVHLGPLAIRRSWQGNHSKHARTYPLRHRANRTALARSISALKDDNYTQTFLLHPGLHLA